MKGSDSFHFFTKITILEKKVSCIFVYYEKISTSKFLKIYGQKKSIISTIYDKMEMIK